MDHVIATAQAERTAILRRHHTDAWLAERSRTAAGGDNA
ncbi:hypothetical protein SAMN04489730_0031 [Amycolatopsis australiensis]|uniref:Uncharacterized protein n=1 Tax=Amycolatopsis australiensis TaxID=546364 RepID=A0A1K1LKX1_9PSEU|nr:hypothetical protein SAMN04489730_0031 [Amycolatopsis australiensis]